MNRALAMLAATACAALAVSSACFAADWPTLPFRLAKTKDAGRVQFSIQHRQGGQRSGQLVADGGAGGPPGTWRRSARRAAVDADPVRAGPAGGTGSTALGRFDPLMRVANAASPPTPPSRRCWRGAALAGRASTRAFDGDEQFPARGPRCAGRRRLPAPDDRPERRAWHLQHRPDLCPRACRSRLSPRLGR